MRQGVPPWKWVYIKCRYYSPLHKSVKTEIFSLSLDLGVAVVWHQIRDHVTPACDYLRVYSWQDSVSVRYVTTALYSVIRTPVVCYLNIPRSQTVNFVKV